MLFLFSIKEKISKENRKKKSKENKTDLTSENSITNYELRITNWKKKFFQIKKNLINNQATKSLGISKDVVLNFQ